MLVPSFFFLFLACFDAIFRKLKSSDQTGSSREPSWSTAKKNKMIIGGYKEFIWEEEKKGRYFILKLEKKSKKGIKNVEIFGI